MRSRSSRLRHGPRSVPRPLGARATTARLRKAPRQTGSACTAAASGLPFLLFFSPSKKSQTATHTRATHGPPGGAGRHHVSGTVAALRGGGQGPQASLAAPPSARLGRKSTLGDRLADHVRDRDDAQRVVVLVDDEDAVRTRSGEAADGKAQCVRVVAREGRRPCLWQEGAHAPTRRSRPPSAPLSDSWWHAEAAAAAADIVP